MSDSLWPMDCSPPSSSVHGILQERLLEWIGPLLQGIFLTQGQLRTYREQQAAGSQLCVLSHSVSDSATRGLQPSRLLCTWDSPGKNTALGSLSLLQGIFPTQWSNPNLNCLQYWQVGSLPLASPGKPLIYVYMHTTMKWLNSITDSMEVSWANSRS